MSAPRHSSRTALFGDRSRTKDGSVTVAHAFPFPFHQLGCMARDSKQKPQKGIQRSLDSFFGAPNAKDKDEIDREVSEHDSEHDIHESDAPVVRKKDKHAAPDASDLPPISDITSIFDDLVSHIPEIQNVARQVLGRKLRVATMCSGTESPLLALDLIRKAVYEQYDVDLDIEHVFSCEIEPFKQAYIERNFQPPLLFRDVCELGNPEA